MKLRKNGKMQKLSGTRSSVQSPFHKQNFCNSGQNLCESRYPILLGIFTLFQMF